MKGSVLSTLAMVVASYVSYYWLQHVSWYQVSTSVRGVWDLIHLPEDEIEACARAYEYMIDTSNVADKSDTAVETEHVRAYYQVINRLLAIADIEKMVCTSRLTPGFSLYPPPFIPTHPHNHTPTHPHTHTLTQDFCK